MKKEFRKAIILFSDWGGGVLERVLVTIRLIW